MFNKLSNLFSDQISVHNENTNEPEAEAIKIPFRNKLEGKNIVDYIDEIKTAITGVTKQWIKLSEILLEAKRELSQKEFSYLKHSIDLSTSTIYKLLKVAECNRLQQNKETLNSIKNWVILYEMTHLSDSQFDEMMNKYFSDGVANKITLKELRGIRENKVPIKFSGSPLLQIRLNTKGLDDPDYVVKFEQAICESIIEIQDRFDLDVNFQSFALETKLEKRLYKEMEREINKEVKELRQKQRKKLQKIIKRILDEFPNPDKKNGIPSKKDQFYKRWGLSHEEIFDVDDLNKSLEYFCSEPIYS